MSTETKPEAAQPAPSIQIVSQYVKDLSFENPNAPRSLTSQTPPQVQINVDVRTNQLSETTYEVILNLKAEAKVSDQSAFICELSYGGVAQLQNVQKDQAAPYLLIEVPRLLFPFARSVIAEATRNGGFPPLLVQPIDFADLFRRQLEALRAKQKPGEPAPSSPIN